MTLQVVWSEQSIIDLKNIYEWILEISVSPDIAKKVKAKLIQKTKELSFPQQYQIDEILGVPYRRLIVGHYKIVYKTLQNNQILVLRIFDTRTNPSKYCI